MSLKDSMTNSSSQDSKLGSVVALTPKWKKLPITMPKTSGHDAASTGCHSVCLRGLTQSIRASIPCVSPLAKKRARLPQSAGIEAAAAGLNARFNAAVNRTVYFFARRASEQSIEFFV